MTMLLVYLVHRGCHLVPFERQDGKEEKEKGRFHEGRDLEVVSTDLRLTLDKWKWLAFLGRSVSLFGGAQGLGLNSGGRAQVSMHRILSSSWASRGVD